MIPANRLFVPIIQLHREVLFSIPTDEKIIALTIDDGPDASTTPQILEVLKSYDAHATLFVLSDQVPGNEPLLENAREDGHEIANHLNTDVPSILFNPIEFESRLLEAEQILSPFDPPAWFRPGSGWINEEMLDTLDRNGYRTVLGSIYPFDSQIPSTWFATQYILWLAKPGGIIVLHDRGDRGIRTVETLQVILPELRSQGYRILNLSELTEYQSGVPDQKTPLHH